MHYLPRVFERLLAGLLTLALLAVIGVGAVQRFAPWRSQHAVVATPDITVSIAGQVRRPGTYTVAFGARAGELLELAGGFLHGAAEALFHPARVLRDGEQLYIPSQASTDAPLVSINSASLAELQTLPGVGPVMAGRIVAGRPYSALEQLLGVSGIGEKTFARFAAFIGL